MKWTHTTKGNEHKEIPKLKDILVQFKSNSTYEVLSFYIDNEYGMVAPTYESYVAPEDVKKFILIEEIS